MHKTQEYKELKSFLEEGFDISIIQGKYGLCAVSCGKEIELSKEVKEYIKTIYDEDGSLCKEAIKCMVENCYIVNRIEIEKNGSPKILSIDPITGRPNYAQWKLYIGFHKNVICKFDNSIFCDGEIVKSKYQKMVESYISENTANKRIDRSVYSNYSLLMDNSREDFIANKKEKIEGDPEDWGPETF